jgi:predicted HTH transcriptional regulator
MPSLLALLSKNDYICTRKAKDRLNNGMNEYSFKRNKDMALAINIENLLNKQKIESNRIEFKKGWNPPSIYHSVCAFANDFDDLGGGYIVVGVDTDEDTGMAIRPVKSPVGSETSSETKPKSSESSSERKKKSSERILDLIKNKPTISAAEIAMEIDMSARGVEKQIRKLREAGIIKRIGADFGGYWEIIER